MGTRLARHGNRLILLPWRCHGVSTVKPHDWRMHNALVIFVKQAMRYSFFHLRRHVEVNVLGHGSTWRWAFVIDGQRSPVTSKSFISTAAKGLQRACVAARKVIEQSAINQLRTQPARITQ